MGLGIAIKKNKLSNLPEASNLFDLYWGGKERRITGLTLRIMAVNAIALLMLMLGFLYLGQYQNSLIEAKLETFKAEIELVSTAISESAIKNSQPDIDNLYQNKPDPYLDILQAKRMVKRLSQTTQKKILLFDKDGNLITNSHKLTGSGGIVQIVNLNPEHENLYSVQVLKNITKFIGKLFPDNQKLPLHPLINSDQVKDYPNAYEALNGQISLSAWSNADDGILLTAAAPLYTSKNILGAVLLTRDGKDIEIAIAAVWVNILQIFLGTLIITILLSIYLSGTIARPLRKLSTAAEAVRTGKSKDKQIPDLSYRHDEIGELSLVLRAMTQALWDRMDLIERFAADVAHELKNPLTSLRSAIETATIVKKKSDQKKLFEIIMHDLERLDRLISDISNASRLDTELSRESFKPVDLKTILERLIDVYKRPLERQNSINKKKKSTDTHNAHINLDMIQDDGRYVWGLEGHLTQVFDNLISNAISFSPDNAAITIRVRTKDKQTYITLEDQGPGIPDTKLETIFERFYSERPEHEDYGRHSGLGLSICKQIIKAHNGEIYAQNIENNDEKVSGTVFTVILNAL